MHLAPTLLVLATNGEQPGGASALGSLVPLLLIGAAFYFLLIRPQRKRQQDQQRMLSRLEVGDEIVTIGGFHGLITEVHDDHFRVELAPGLEVSVVKSAISRTRSEPAVVDPFDEDEDELSVEDLSVEDLSVEDEDADVREVDIITEDDADGDDR